MNPKSTRNYWILALIILMGLGLALALPTLALAQRTVNSDRSSVIGNNPTLMTDGRLLTTAPNAGTADDVSAAPGDESRTPAKPQSPELR